MLFGKMELSMRNVFIFSLLISTVVFYAAIIWFLAGEEVRIAEENVVVTDGSDEGKQKDAFVFPIDSLTVKKDEDTLISISEDLRDQQETRDVFVQETSLAEIPDAWRAFYYSDIPHSDPEFVFGCGEYRETGEILYADFFRDQAGRYWVPERSGNVLIGVGEISQEQSELLNQYFAQEEEIGCLQLLQRDYIDYTIITPNVSVVTEGDFTYLDLHGLFAPLPEDVQNDLMNTIDARVIGTDLVFVSEEGIEQFDLQSWKRTLLQPVQWGDLRGLSQLVYDPEFVQVVFAIEYWGDDAASVQLYQLSQEGESYELFSTTAQMAWQIGTSAHAQLEYHGDLTFTTNGNVEIIRRPEYDLHVQDGSFPPDPGMAELVEWQVK